MAEHSHTTTDSSLRCVVVTPEATVVDTAAEFVAVPMIDGEYGIAPGHSPVIGRLGYGELRIRTGSGVKRFFADGGFVQVANDVVSVLTNRAIAKERIDFVAATELLATALARPAVGDEQLTFRERAIAQARGQLRVATRFA